MRKQSSSNRISSHSDREYAPGRPQIGQLSKFFLLWLIVPFVLRTLIVWQNTPSQFSPFGTISTVAFRIVMAFPQDLFVAAQAFVVCFALHALFMQRWLGRLGTWLAVGFCTALFTFVQVYLFGDYLVFAKTGVRVDVSLLFTTFHERVRDLMLNTSQAIPLLCGFALLLLLIAIAFRFFGETFSEINLSYRHLFWISLSVMTGLGSARYIPTELSYIINNPIIHDESVALFAVLSQADKFPIETDETKLLSHCRQSEQFKVGLPDYSYLKNTQSFTGEKQCDVRVATDERPHVIFLQLESFRAANVGVLGGKVPASPNFDRLAQEGILFTDFYANGVRAPRAGLSSLFGVLPNFAPREVQMDNTGIPLIGVPDLLHARGYQNAFAMGSSLDYENAGPFYRRHGFDSIHGLDELKKAFPTATRSSWGIHDEYLMHYATAWLKQQDHAGHPSFLFARTTTNRQPWETPASFKAPRFDVTADGEYSRYLQTYSYTDACVGLLMKLLQEQGLAEKTIVFVFGDHGMPMGEHFDNFSVSNYLFEENVRVPLLILAPGRIEHPTIVSDVGSQIDLLPTVMDMLQLTGDNHSLGTSLLRHVSNRTVVFNNPFAMQYVGMRQGEWKYVYTARSRTGSLFNLKNDPDELSNVAALHPDLVSQYHAHVMGLTQSTTRHFWQESFAPGAVNDKTPALTNNNTNTKKPTPPADQTTATTQPTVIAN